MDDFTKDLLSRSLQLTERCLLASGDAPEPEIKQLHDDIVAGLGNSEICTES